MNPRRREGLGVTVVSAGFVALGIALGDRVPWYATAFFAVCLAIGVLTLLGVLPTARMLSPFKLTIDDVGITRTGRKLREHVAWGDIARVRIITTDQGPQLEDVFFVIDGKNDTGCVVSHDLAVKHGLLDALHARLGDVSNAAVIEAMTSVENREFTIWEAK